MLRVSTSFYSVISSGEQLILKFGSKFLHFWKLRVDRARSLGTVAPSSRYLARDMVTELKKNHSENGVVVELGPGNGAITRHILSSVQDPESVLPIEISSDSVEKLNRKFPVLNAVHDSAANLEKYITNGQKVQAIISGLPLRVMPRDCVHQIGEAIHNVMGPDSIYVQYTYDLRPKKDAYFKRGNFKKISSRIVWRNLPPARVDVFVAN